MRYGLAKMHFVQEKYGYEPDATFVTTPDETISRNAVRWESGFSYGGKLSWGSGHDKFMILDVKPNACGMLVGGLDYLPKPKDILKRVYELEHKADFIHDIKVEWDFYKGNHFIDVFRTETDDKRLRLPKYAVILHAGCPEFKGPNIHGPGLYWNESPYLMKVSSKVDTPLGHVHILAGHDAVEFMKFYELADDFAHKRRALAFKHLFRGGKVIINETHQGLVNHNEAVLGCNVTDGTSLVPISIRADIPSYIFKGNKNFTRHQIELLGWERRAEELGVMHKVKNANIIPHGGGYTFPDSLSVDKVFTIKNKRYFQIDMVDSIGKKIVSNMQELQFAYRGREVIQRTLDLDMGEIKAVLHPIYTIKI
ncbi:TPA: hypothetical protein HA265_06290, partial [Candidatus Woesearchaeota archaeon]|nr:hypothetical protein [Candidatus Woesearchaeota archaeon]